jgi:hypothetical protein
MAAGIAFVVLLVFGIFTAVDGPDTSSSDTAKAVDDKYVAWFSDSGNRAEHVIGAYVLIVAGIVFVWFCLGLRERLEAAGVVERTTARLVSALGVLGASALTAAAMTAAVIAGAVVFGGENVPTDGDATHWISNLTFPFVFVVFGLVVAALIAALVVATFRSGVLPRWAGYTGILAVLGALGGVVFLPMVLPLLWFLAVAIHGLARPITPAERVS